MPALLTIAPVAAVFAPDPPEAAPAEPRGPKILAVTLTDGSARGTLRWAARWAERCGGALYVLHGEPVADPYRDGSPVARLAAHRLIEELLGAPLPASRLYLAAPPLLDPIVATAVRIDAALVVLGEAHNRGSGARGRRLGDQLVPALRRPVMLAGNAALPPSRPALRLC